MSSERLGQFENGRRPFFRQLLEQYMAGDSHVHTIFSNPESRHEADYTFEQIFEYLKNEIDKGTNRAQFVILAEHASDAGDPQSVNGKDLIDHHNSVHAFNQEMSEQGMESPKLVSGVEASIISPDGKVDVPDEILAQMDFVIASKHDLRKVFPESNGDPNAEQLTTMYLGLMDNQHIDAIGHPNRYVKMDDLQKMDWDQIFQKAKNTHTALEINLNAIMPDELIEKAVRAGVPLIIGTDMHTLAQYQQLPESVRSQIETADDRLNFPPGFKFWWRIARVLKVINRAGATSEQVITSSYDRLYDWLSKEKSERTLDWQNAGT